MNAGSWRGWVVAAAIFVLGLAVGAAGMTWLGVHRLRQALAAPASAGLAERAATRIGANLTKSLQLTPDESQRVQATLDRAARRLKAVRIRAGLQARAELRAAIDEIAEGLPPEKRAEFHRLVAQRFARLGFAPPGEPATEP